MYVRYAGMQMHSWTYTLKNESVENEKSVEQKVLYSGKTKKSFSN